MAEENAAPAPSQNKKPKTGIIAGIAVAVVAIIVILFAFVFNKSGVVGKYNIEAFIENGKESTEMIQLLKAFGGNYTIEFKNDKTGAIEMKAGDESQTINFKWDDKKIKMEQDGETAETEYKYENDTVTVTVEGKSMKFKREGK